MVLKVLLKFVKRFFFSYLISLSLFLSFSLSLSLSLSYNKIPGTWRVWHAFYRRKEGLGGLSFFSTQPIRCFVRRRSVGCCGSILLFFLIIPPSFSPSPASENPTDETVTKLSELEEQVRLIKKNQHHKHK